MALTEKFESNSKPMKIHISQPCKDLLSPQYKCVERTDEGLSEKVKSVRFLLKIWGFIILSPFQGWWLEELLPD